MDERANRQTRKLSMGETLVHRRHRHWYRVHTPLEPFQLLLQRVLW